MSASARRSIGPVGPDPSQTGGGRAFGAVPTSEKGEQETRAIRSRAAHVAALETLGTAQDIALAALSDPGAV
jgi:hypothetical protein